MANRDARCVARALAENIIGQTNGSFLKLTLISLDQTLHITLEPEAVVALEQMMAEARGAEHAPR